MSNKLDSLEGTCGTCRFYVVDQFVKSTQGTCHRRSPSAQYGWPRVWDDSSCGEYEEIPVTQTLISSLPENGSGCADAVPSEVVQDVRLASTYGFCPICNYHIVSRERRIDGNDTCRNGHKFPSKDAVPG